MYEIGFKNDDKQFTDIGFGKDRGKVLMLVKALLILKLHLTSSSRLMLKAC